MLDELILHELNKLENQLGSTEAGDSLYDHVLIGSIDDTIHIGEKKYLKSGLSIPLSETPDYVGENLQLDCKHPYSLQVKSVNRSATPESGAGVEYKPDRNGIVWMFRDYYLTTNVARIWYSKDNCQSWNYYLFTLTGVASETVVQWLIADGVFIFLTTSNNIYYNETPTDPAGWKLSGVKFGSTPNAQYHRLLYFPTTNLLQLFDCTGKYCSFPLNYLWEVTSTIALDKRYTTKTTTSNSVLYAASDVNGNGCLVSPALAWSFHTYDGGLSWSDGPASASILGGYGSTLHFAGKTVYFITGYDVYYFNVIWQKVNTLGQTSATRPYRFVKRLYSLNDKWILKLWQHAPSSGSDYYKLEICPVSDIGKSTPGVVIDPPVTAWDSGSFNVLDVYHTANGGVYMSCLIEKPRGTYSDIYIDPNAIGIFEDTDYAYLRIK